MEASIVNNKCRRKTMVSVLVFDGVKLTLDEIKYLESVCRKQRKRLKSNGGSNKCNRTIDMFNDEDTEDE